MSFQKKSGSDQFSQLTTGIGVETDAVASKWIDIFK